MMIGIGAMEALIVSAMLLGGAGSMSGFGVPLPPDAGLEAAAPPECLFFYSHAGAAKPDANSTNHVERLSAEPAIGEFIAELDRLGNEMAKQIPSPDPKGRAAIAALPTVVRALLSRPCVFYVGSAAVPPAAPNVQAALVINAGDGVAAFRDAALAWEKFYLDEFDLEIEVTQSGTAELRRIPMPPDVPPVAPPVFWGVDGEYVFLTVGQDEADALLKRMAARGPPAPWLKQLRDDAGVPRPCDTLYLDVAGLMRTIDPLINQAALFMPINPRKILDEFGVQHVRYVAVATGLNESVSVAKLLVGHEENATGLLAFLEEKPLTKEDFVDVPNTADIAFVAHCDAKVGYDRILKMTGMIDPRSIEYWHRDLARAEADLGFSFEDELLGALGDRWVVYNSTAEGGALFTGLCAVATVRDRAKAEKVIDGIVALVEKEANRFEDRREVAFKETKVGERTIRYMQFLRDPIPVAPAWCLTEDKLVFALSPQMVRVHLSRAADAPTLAEREDVAEKLSTGDVIALTYSDGRQLASVVYSYVQYLATMGAGVLAKETGIEADLSKFPPYTAIGPHLQPSVCVLRHGKTLSSLESYSVGPTLGPAVAMGVGVMVPTVMVARTEARTAVIANDLRILTVAALQYSTDKNEPMPAAILDADGKPLLSWRVALLPYLDRQDLYDRFHLDEPWDGEHNRQLLAEMPSFYMHPSMRLDRESGRTVFQLPRGKGTLYDGDKPPTEAEIDALPIGRSQTVLFVETKSEFAVEWTKPADVPITPDTLFDRLNVQADGTVKTAMNDGSVINLPTLLDRSLLLPMFFPRSAD